MSSGTFNEEINQGMVKSESGITAKITEILIENGSYASRGLN